MPHLALEWKQKYENYCNTLENSCLLGVDEKFEINPFFNRIVLHCIFRNKTAWCVQDEADLSD